MISVTALILTFNERENIERTMRALAWVERVVIIDSFSSDETVTLARAIRPDVVMLQRTFDTFAGQCNFGLTQISTPWVLSLDADYVLTPELIDEIKVLEPPTDVSGYSTAFYYCVLGHPLRATIYPRRTVLYRRERGRYVDEGHGHKVRVDGAIRLLSGKIEHDDRKPLSRWLSSQDSYFKIEARHLISTANDQLNRQDRLRKKIFFAPGAVFFYLLIGKGLILDGWRGWYYVCQRTIAEMLLSLRLLTERENLESGLGPAEPRG
jgi:glycosyltransferase involved in cell wall biosynthesis